MSKGALGWPLGADAARLLRTERLPRILCSAPKNPPELSGLWPDEALAERKRKASAFCKGINSSRQGNCLSLTNFPIKFKLEFWPALV